MEKKETKRISVAEKSNVAVKSSVRGKNGVKKEIKSPEQMSKNIEPKLSKQESKDAQIEKLICQNKSRDVSLDILYNDMVERNRKFRSLKMKLDDKDNIVIVDKDSKISRLEKEIASKNTHIEKIKSKLIDQVRSQDIFVS